MLGLGCLFLSASGVPTQALTPPQPVPFGVKRRERLHPQHRTRPQRDTRASASKTSPRLSSRPLLAQAPAAPATSEPAPVAAPPQPAASNAPVAAPTAVEPAVARNEKGEPLVTNVFADTELKQALADISAQTGVTIVADNTVQGIVTADLKGVPLERALAIILQSGGYAFAALDGYYLVGAPVPDNPNFYLLSRFELVELRHVRPEAVLDLLALPYGRYLSAEGAVPVPPSSASGASTSSPFAAPRRIGLNRSPQVTTPASGIAAPAEPMRISITAPPLLIEPIKAAIARLDQPRTQVVIEAAVLEISEEALKDLSVNFVDRLFGNRNVAINTAPESQNVTFSSVATDDIIRLTALVQRGVARLRANPRLATAEGQTAEIEVGRESYFSINTGSSAFPNNTLEVIRSGIFLRITPRVLEGEREVVTRLEPEVRDVTGRGPNGLPEITFRRAATNLRVRDGQSIVIGGLINEFTSQARTKIPLLGDIPVLGRAFRGTSSRQNRTETIIIITPRILSDNVPLDGIGSPVLRQDVLNLRSGQTPAPFAFPATEKKPPQR